VFDSFRLSIPAKLSLARGGQPRRVLRAPHRAGCDLERCAAGRGRAAPQVAGGRDLQAGGTWFGITRTGRFAALTNYRDPSRLIPNAPSRGRLTSDYLQGDEPARRYLERLSRRAGDYNGFNLLVGDSEGLFYYANYSGKPRVLEPGVYGLSNHFLDTPWPKVRRGVESLRQLLARKADPEPDDLLALLTDRAIAPDDELPQTGIPLEWERWLSPGMGTLAIAAVYHRAGIRHPRVLRAAGG